MAGLARLRSRPAGGRPFLPRRSPYTARFRTALLLILAVNVFGTLGYLLIERWSFLDALFMTVITETTIGYGTPYPLSANGSIFTILLIVVSVGSFGYALSTGVAFIVEGEFNRIIQGQRMDHRIAKLQDHIILCSAGYVGWHIAQEFLKTQTPFVLIERDPLKIQSFLQMGDILYVQGDPTTDETLRAAGIERAKGLVAALDDDKDNVFVVLSANALKPTLRIVAQLITEENAEKLRKAGADEIISPTAIGGLRMASVMLRPAVVTFLDEMMRATGQVMRVEEVHIADAPSLTDVTLAEANIEQRTGLLVVALKSPDGGYQFNPPRQTMLRAADILIVMGPRERIALLERAKTA